MAAELSSKIPDNRGMKIKINKLEKLITEALLKKYTKKQVDLMLPVIIFGELSGKKSHGLIRLYMGGKGILTQKTKGKPKTVEKSDSSKIIIGNSNPGMLIGSMACDEVIKLAKKNNIGMVGTRGSVGSSGSLTYYSEKIAKEDLIAIVMARAPGDVAPHGGLERIFGTNPISFGIPTAKQPLVFDMATSAISYGAVMVAKKSGEKLPDNVAIDKAGKPTSDPNEALEGAFLPFDKSYKGAGLAMMIEILAGILTGADFANSGIGDEWGNLFITINPKNFIPKKIFKERVTTLVERVRNSKSIDGNKIRIPGEYAIRNRDNARLSGWVDVSEDLVQGIELFIQKANQ